MADEETKEITEETEETETEEVEGTEETKEEHSESNTDYEAELNAEIKAERERREKAERALAGKAFKNRDKKRVETEPDEDESDEDKPLSRKEFLEALEERDRRIEKRSQESEAFVIAKKHSSSESEAKAAVEFWRNRVVPTGNLEEDVLFALGGLNRKRVQAQNSELKRALTSKETKSDTSTGTYRDAPKSGEPKASKDITAIKASGYAWDGTKQAYKKALPKGKTIFYDPKTKKTWVQ